MSPSLASLLRFIGRGLVIGLLALGQSGGDAWAQILHQLSCECCGTDPEKPACCSSGSADEGPVLTNSEKQGCACTAAPSDSSPAPLSAPLPSDSSVREQIASHLDVGVAWNSGMAVWASAATRQLDPPPWALERAGSFVGCSDRFLRGSGGERSACLGCARS